MAKVPIKVVSGLFEEVIIKFNAEFKDLKYCKRNEYFLNLSIRLSKFSDKKINTATLYKGIYLEIMKLKRQGAAEFSISNNYLNSFTFFLYNMPFSELFMLNSQKEEKPFKDVLFNYKPIDDPQTYEFPFEHPRFPASPTIGYNILVKNIELEIFIKDESTNPTGTHTDRMAYELAQFFIHKKAPNVKLFLTSTGWSAIALFNEFRARNLHLSLHVFMPETKEFEKIQFFKYLKERYGEKRFNYSILDSSGLPRFAEKRSLVQKGYINFNESSQFAELKSLYYDWLSYEIFNQNPDIVIVPIGTGDLFLNILLCLRKEQIQLGKSKRFFGNKTNLKTLTIIGVGPSNSDQGNVPALNFHKSIRKDMSYQLDQMKINRLCHANSSILLVNSEDWKDKVNGFIRVNKINAETSSLIGIAALQNLSEYDLRNKKILIVNLGKLKRVSL